jgi:hypothetical protein
LKDSLSQNIDLTIAEKINHLTPIADHNSHGRSQKRKRKKDLLNRKLRDPSVRSRDHNVKNSLSIVGSRSQLLSALKINGKIEEVNSMAKALKNLSSLSKKDHNRIEKDLLNSSTSQIQPTLQAAIHTLQLKSNNNSHSSASQMAGSHKLLKRGSQVKKMLELCST